MLRFANLAAVALVLAGPGAPSGVAVAKTGVGGAISSHGISGSLRLGGLRLRASTRHQRHRAARARTGGMGDSGGSVPAPPLGPAMDNAAVLTLTRAGLGNPAILAKIRSSSANYDTATATLLTLRRAGVSSEVLGAMIEAQSAAGAPRLADDSPDPAAAHPAGIYVLADWLNAPKMLALRPTATARTRSGGILAYALTGGLVPVAYRAVVTGPHAAITAGTPRPTFYFYTGGTASPSARWGGAPDPDSLALVRLTPDKQARSFRIGSFSLAGASTGVRTADAIAFSAAEAAPGVMAVRPDADLALGEYGFVSTAGGTGPGGAEVATSTAVVFDFAVGPRAAGSHEGMRGTPAGVTPVQPDFPLDLAASLVTGGKTRRAAKVKLPKEPRSAPSLYPGGKGAGAQ